MYCLTIIVLIIVLIDSHVVWYESMSMLIASFGYTVLMYFNVSIEEWAQDRFGKLFGTSKPDSGLTLVSFKSTVNRSSDTESSSSGTNL